MPIGVLHFWIDAAHFGERGDHTSRTERTLERTPSAGWSPRRPDRGSGEARDRPRSLVSV